MNMKMKESSSLYELSMATYFLDLILSSVIGYIALTLSYIANNLLTEMLFLISGSIFLYRALFFIHEIAHHYQKLKWFKWTWFAMIGSPFLIPPIFYYKVHLQHHSNKYSTINDPEYQNLKNSNILKKTLFLFLPVLSPIFLLIRFTLISFLSIFSKRINEWKISKGSSLTMYLEDYERPLLNKKELKELHISELILFMLSFLYLISIQRFSFYGILRVQLLEY